MPMPMPMQQVQVQDAGCSCERYGGNIFTKFKLGERYGGKLDIWQELQELRHVVRGKPEEDLAGSLTN